MKHEVWFWVTVLITTGAIYGVARWWPSSPQFEMQVHFPMIYRLDTRSGTICVYTPHALSDEQAALIAQARGRVRQSGRVELLGCSNN